MNDPRARRVVKRYQANQERMAVERSLRTYKLIMNASYGKDYASKFPEEIPERSTWSTRHVWTGLLFYMVVILILLGLAEVVQIG